MATLTKDNPNARELITEALDKTLWWSTLKLIVEFLRAKTIEKVRVEFGFVLDRHIAGKQKPPDKYSINRPGKFIDERSFDVGTIEWKRSDFFNEFEGKNPPGYGIGHDPAVQRCGHSLRLH